MQRTAQFALICQKTDNEKLMQRLDSSKFSLNLLWISVCGEEDH